MSIDWRQAAACVGAEDDMFPGSLPDDIEQAKGHCRRCPVADECLRWALEIGEEYGVYGGRTEAERRTLRRRAARPARLDEYTGTREPRQQTTSLKDAWERYTLPDGEHVLWIGPKAIARPRPQSQVTPNRLAFFLDRGRWPEGDTKRTCGVHGCVRSAHLTDRVERAEEAELAVTV